MNGQRASHLANWRGRDYWAARPGNMKMNPYRSKARSERVNHKTRTHRLERRIARRELLGIT